MTSPKNSPEYPAPSWLWTARLGSLVSWGIVVVALVAIWAIKWGGLRDEGVITAETARWALGWLPSFLTGLGLPFAWPAFRRPLHRIPLFQRPALRPLMRITFLPECVTAALLLIAGEVFDGLFPQIGNTAVQTFASSDLVATIAGAAGAFGLFRLLDVLQSGTTKDTP